MTRALARAGRGVLLGAGVFGVIGLVLSAWSISRGHYALHTPLALAGVLASWTALSAGYGAAVGAAAVLVALRVRSDRLARRICRALVAAGAAATLAASVVPVYSTWDLLGPAVPLPLVSALPEHPERATPPNLVLISVDTLRADALGTYGARRDTSPAIDRWAAGGTVFEWAISQSPETRRAMAALMTGLYPHVFDYEQYLRGSDGPLIGAGFTTIGERLRQAGYTTGGFVSNPLLERANGYAQGYDTWDDTSGMYGPGERRTRDVDDLLAPAIAWIERVEPPFHLILHVMDPHQPYEPALVAPWEAEATGFDQMQRLYGGLSVDGYTERMKQLRDGETEPLPGEIEFLRGRYDAEVLATDAGIERLLVALRRRGFDDRNTLIVLTADHGEEFMDHGGLLHGHTLYDELLHVPLVMTGPGVPVGLRVEQQVRLLDVAATLLDWAGLPADDLDARTLRPFFDGGAPPSRPALSFRGRRYVSLRTPASKLVAAFEPYDAGRIASVRPTQLVSLWQRALRGPKRRKVGFWDLAADPGESENLLYERRPRAADAYAELDRLRAASPLLRVASQAQQGLSDETVEVLRALGYAE